MTQRHELRPRLQEVDNCGNKEEKAGARFSSRIQLGKIQK